MLECVAKTKGVVNYFHKIFAKIGSRVKSSEKSTNWFFVKLDKISVLYFFIKNQPAVLFIRENKEQIANQCIKERIDRFTQAIYIDSLLTKSYIQSSVNHWEFTKQSKQDYKTHTKSVDLEPLKNTKHSLETPQFSKTLSETSLHRLHRITLFKRRK